ncbi:histidine kinase [Lipingzhangella sp. LS1_29]|uniref:Histidine kinase n=1 Tax=Lipingzhangella rawalii TaxID=2055835 RepID=A0ABU2H848_9ACTN|nr:histidine kinase [Lipingzhangella rawalii]MDS1270769.1 histidine kinase [Lipingzhangella rawalii]
MATAEASRTEPAPSDTTSMAPRLAWGLTTVVFACLCLIGFLNVRMLPIGPLAMAMAIGCMLALFVLQMLQCRWVGHPERQRYAQAALVAQGCLAYLPLLYYQQAWVGMPSFFGGSVLLVLSGKLAWISFTGVLASMAFIQALLSGNPLDVGYTTVATLVFALTVYGISYLREIVRRLQSAQGELADAAVTRERLRFTRDLNDLLGHSLSAMILKAELAYRLVTRRSERAPEEVKELVHSSRQALADVRSVARNYREFSLESELRSMRSVLAAAGVELHLRTDHDELPTPVATVLGRTLREGITNLLRHSNATSCTVTVRQDKDQVTGEIVNDGANMRETGMDLPSAGGLRDIQDRAVQLGGNVTTETLTGGRFRLTVHLPLTPDNTDHENT